MKVVVLGASGRAGSAITRELAERHHQVLAIARRVERIAAQPNVTAVSADASNPAVLAKLITSYDALISALSFDIKAATLLSAVKQAGVPRLLVTGGAGSLEVAPGQMLIDSPDFPEIWRKPASAGVDFLNELQAEDDVNWTFFSPAHVIFEGPRQGHYRLGGDQLLKDLNGESRISFADYAIAMVDELERGAHNRSRFTAAY